MLVVEPLAPLGLDLVDERAEAVDGQGARLPGSGLGRGDQGPLRGLPQLEGEHHLGQIGGLVDTAVVVGVQSRGVLVRASVHTVEHVVAVPVAAQCGEVQDEPARVAGARGRSVAEHDAQQHEHTQERETPVVLIVHGNLTPALWGGAARFCTSHTLCQSPDAPPAEKKRGVHFGEGARHATGLTLAELELELFPGGGSPRTLKV